MAASSTSLQTDRDLTSIAEARALARRARQAGLELAEFSQERINKTLKELQEEQAGVAHLL